MDSRRQKLLNDLNVAERRQRQLTEEKNVALAKSIRAGQMASATADVARSMQLRRAADSFETRALNAQNELAGVMEEIYELQQRLQYSAPQQMPPQNLR